ncbi:Hypothetical predicted protein [Xyrichtys novacula]|uniref:Uncharacterized protein n=1 Tax=Xyrichtys novacula TaxID=13765 RepID=A0AAV1HDD1_XYRNO|nr:Hypothetical predicted protein [Xyrichtys novacula]
MQSRAGRGVMMGIRGGGGEGGGRVSAWTPPLPPPPPPPPPCLCQILLFAQLFNFTQTEQRGQISAAPSSVPRVMAEG